jgi:hypothetical protein
MNIKFKEKTPDFSKPDLCDTCKWVTMIEGERHSDTRKFCNVTRSEIKFKVSKCSTFNNLLDKSLHEMERMAYILTGKVSGKIGFKHYKDLTNSEKLELIRDVSDREL